MRRISVVQMLVFLSLFLLAAGGAIATTWGALGSLPLGDFRGVVLIMAVGLMLYVYAMVIYRIFMAVFPLRTGEVQPGSSMEFVYHVYILFFLILFYPILRGGFVPAPLMRLFYLALGARLGENTYSMGIIHDPIFVEIGADSVVGQSALIIPHVIEGSKLAHYPIRIGNNVTIGAQAVILSDVIVGDHAIVATGAVVSKGTRIGAGEVWGGVPARRIR